MQRKARINVPGALHHIIVRSIECRKTFRDDAERINFLDRLGGIVVDTQTQCVAWKRVGGKARHLTESPSFAKDDGD